MNIFLLALTLIICLVMLEVIVKVFFPQSLLVERYDTKLGILLKPDLDIMQYNQQLKNDFSYNVVTNSQGLRENEDISLEKGDKFRILLFGDSFIFGKGVNQEETTSFILDEMTGDDVKVVNFGVPGVNLDHYYLNFLKTRMEFNPDVVVFNIFAGNDFGSQGAFFTVKDGLLRFEEGELEYNPPKEKNNIQFFLASNLQFPRFLVLLLDSNSITRKIIKPLGLSHGEKMPLFTSSEEEYTRYKELNFEILKSMKKISEEKNFKFVVFLLPSKEQVDDKAYSGYVESYSIGESIERYEIQEDLSKFMKDENILFHDLTNSFIEENKKVQLYYDIDIHWNSEGNLFAAEEMYDELKKLDALSF